MMTGISIINRYSRIYIDIKNNSGGVEILPPLYKLIIQKDYTIMFITMTFQPNKTNCSKRKLIDDFNYTLKRFYRKIFGSRYYKHKDKQFKFTIFYSIGKRNQKHPHLHIIADVEEKYIASLHFFLYRNMKKIYPSLTVDLQNLPTTKDFEYICKYYAEQAETILNENDLYEKNYKI